MIWITGSFFAICLLLIILLYLTQREIKRMAVKLKEITGRAQYGARLYLDESNKSLGQIAEAINRLIDEYEEKLRRVENMEQNIRLSISGISHDLRTPLTSLKGYLQLLEKTDASEKRMDYIDVINGSVKVLSDLIDNFYDLSRLEMGDNIFILESINLERAVSEHFLGYYENFATKNIEVTIHGAEILPIVSADLLALDRALNNLIQNLLRYAKSAVEISFSDEDDAHVLTISNDTDTVLPQDADRIFERFYTSDPSRSGKNAGLGLYITRKLIEGIGGKITARYEDNRLSVIIKLNRSRFL